MESEYDHFGVTSSGPPAEGPGSHLEPRFGQSPPEVRAQQAERDHSLLSMLTVRCAECGRYLVVKDGGFVTRPADGDKPGPLVYCDGCVTSEPIG